MAWVASQHFPVKIGSVEQIDLADKALTGDLAAVVHAGERAKDPARNSPHPQARRAFYPDSEHVLLGRR